MSQIEQMEYTVMKKSGHFEVREYPDTPVVLAETGPDGDYREAFRHLYAYITGANRREIRLDMTAPVLQTEKEGQEFLAFVVPAAQQQMVPVPEDGSLKLDLFPGGLYGSVEFHGLAGERSRQVHLKSLVDWLDDSDFDVTGAPEILALYDPPYKLPFLRHNEILIPVRER